MLHHQNRDKIINKYCSMMASNEVDVCTGFQCYCGFESKRERRERQSGREEAEERGRGRRERKEGGDLSPGDILLRSVTCYSVDG